MAADPSNGYLSTGSGLDVRVWKGGKNRASFDSFLTVYLICLHILQMIGKDMGFWVFLGNLPTTVTQTLF